MGTLDGDREESIGNDSYSPNGHESNRNDPGMKDRFGDDPHREERAFVASLPAWRRFLSRLNWHSPLNDGYWSYNATASKKPSLKNAIHAALLLLLGVGVVVLLIWTQYLLFVLLILPVILVASYLIFAIWKAIYDTLQEGDAN